MRIRRLLAALLCAVTLVSLLPVLPAAAADAAAEDEMKLAYEVNFNGTPGVFEPAGISGNYAHFTYTPSADGSSITIRGKDYAASDPDGVKGQAYWGGIVEGLEATPSKKYAITYKVKNLSTKAYSQVNIGGWITEFGTKYWNLSSTYNAPGTVILGMLNGNADSVGGSNANKTMLQSTADRDADGFLEMKIEYDGAFSTMTCYTKLDGQWEELYVRDIDVSSQDLFGIILYSYRSGAVNMTIKDMKIYEGESQMESEGAGEAVEITGYAQQPKLMTLAEVKPRYGIEKQLTADSGVTAQAVFRNKMDAYLAQIPHAAGSGVSLAEPFSSTGYESLYVTFAAAIDPKKDTAINKDPAQVKLQVTSDGVTWQDSGAVFTVEDAGEQVVAAKGIKTDRRNQYQFNEKDMIPVYQFTSSSFASENIQNIRLVPCDDDAKGTFRLLSLYVWGDTGEEISVPLLDGDLNPEVKITTDGSNTRYELYSTNFYNTHSWTTNVISYRQSSKEKVDGKSRPYTYFSISGNLPTTDGQEVRLYSPDMVLDPSLYGSVMVEFDCFRIAGEGDPALKNTMRLAYSTDNGATWAAMKKAPTVTKVTDGAVEGDGYETYHVSMNIKNAVPKDTVITNIVILPYNEKGWYDVRLTNDNMDSPKRHDDVMLGSKGAFRMLSFSITGISSKDDVAAVPVPVYRRHYDSTVIQTMIDEAAAAGMTEVTIPAVNPRTGGDTWVISETIEIPSNMTLYINNCKLRWEDFVLCHMLENQGAGGQYLALEDQNIHIIGVGNAVLQGGVYNGIGSHLIKDTGISTWSNMMLLLQNVNNFSIENLRIEESRFWGIVLYYCRNGSVQHMDYFDSRAIQSYNNVEIWEQDGIDVRNGCENILVNDVTGRTGDDTVALNAIRPNQYEVMDKSGDIKNITVTNVASKLARGRGQLRITATNGWKIHDVLFDGILDTSVDFPGKDSYQTILLGDSSTGYATISPTQPGDIYNIYFRNFVGCTPYPISVRHSSVRQEHWAYEYDTCENLYSGKSSSALISEGDKKDKIVTPVECDHEWTEKLSGTLHLQGLPAAAATLDWFGCSKCNAVKRPDNYDEVVASAAEETTVNPFSDVPADAYYHDAVLWALEEGVTTGVTASHFQPTAICTRGQVATFLWRAMGKPEPTIANPFSDVSEDSPFYKAILWAYEKGITTGATEATFAPNGTCTSAHVVTFLWRAAGSPEVSGESALTAGYPAGAYYKDAAAWADIHGLLTGVGSGFQPAANAPRADIVTYLYRFNS